MLKNSIFYLSLITILVSIVWLVYDPGFEPFIAIITAAIALVTSKEKKHSNEALTFKATNANKAELAKEITIIAENINQMLSSYTKKLDEARWKPHISISNREEKLQETDALEAEITQKFKMKYEAESLRLLKRASDILKREDYDDKTKILSGSYFLENYCKHLIFVAEELKN